jgi:hypothetical protein
MAVNFVRAVSRVVFWTYPRGGWQYDIVCGLILAFIFLTPKAVFDGSVFSSEEAISVVESKEAGATQGDRSDPTGQ